MAAGTLVNGTLTMNNAARTHDPNVLRSRARSRNRIARGNKVNPAMLGPSPQTVAVCSLRANHGLPMSALTSGTNKPDGDRREYSRPAAKLVLRLFVNRRASAKSATGPIA